MARAGSSGPVTSLRPAADQVLDNTVGDADTRGRMKLCVCTLPACEEFGESRLTSIFQTAVLSLKTLSTALAGTDLSPSIITAALARAAVLKPMYPLLTLDEIAALVVHSSHELPCICINDALCHENYVERLSQWRDYIWLLLNAVSKLPPCPVPVVMHGCARSAAELDIDLEPGSEFTLASFTSASTHGSTSFVKCFFAEEQAHVVWRLELSESIGRDVRDFALQPTSEGEVLLPPAVTFEVLSTCRTTSGLIVSCRLSESESLLDLIAKVRPPSPPMPPSPEAVPSLYLSPVGDSTRSPSSPRAASTLFSDEILASVQLSHALIERYGQGEECGFWFLKADAIRALDKPVLPKLQTIRRDSPSWLVHQTIRFVDLCAGAYRSEYLVVSHRWESPAEPDGTGMQAQAIQQHLFQHPDVNFVWVDVRCL